MVHNKIKMDENEKFNKIKTIIIALPQSETMNLYEFSMIYNNIGKSILESGKMSAILYLPWKILYEVARCLEAE